jgi:hypothetical protein
MAFKFSYRKQAKKFLPHLCKTILELDWNWIILAFRHCLAPALDFICLKEL